MPGGGEITVVEMDQCSQTEGFRARASERESAMGYDMYPTTRPTVGVE